MFVCVCLCVIQRGDASLAVLQVKRHILQVTTHQMAVLLLFNKKTNITFQVRTIAYCTRTPAVRVYSIMQYMYTLHLQYVYTLHLQYVYTLHLQYVYTLHLQYVYTV